MNRLALLLSFVIWLAPISAVKADTPPTNSFTKLGKHRMHKIEWLHRKADRLVIDARFRQAIRVYQEIIFLEPDDKWAYERMGSTYMILGDYPRAKNAFQSALAIDPGDEDAMRGLRKITDPDAL